MSQPRRTVQLQVGIWANEETGHIHLASPVSSGGFITTVTNKPGKRCHPNLYRKLAKVLTRAGKWPAGMPDPGLEAE